MNFKSKIKSLPSQLLIWVCIFLSIIVIVQAIVIHNLKEQKMRKYFLEVKLTKEHGTYQSLQNLKALMVDEDVSKEIKVEAAKKYDEITRNAMYEVKIEGLLQAKGFTNVICFIDESSAKVIIGDKGGLSKEKRKIIEEAVYSVSNIRIVDIQIKK